SRRRHTRCYRDWSSDVCSSDLVRIFNPSPPGVRCRDVEVSGGIKRQPLRPAEAAIENPDLAALRDSVDAVKTRGGWAGDKQLPRSEERRVGEECGSWCGASRDR